MSGDLHCISNGTLIFFLAELSIQRARAAEAEAACQMQRIEAAQAAESDSLAKQELLRLQQEEGEAHRRKLQV